MPSVWNHAAKGGKGAHPTPVEATDSHTTPWGRLLRLSEVMRRMGLEKSAIDQRMSDGLFPKSRPLGPKCAVWIEVEIGAWVGEVALL